MRKKRGKSLQTLEKRDRIVLAVTLIAMKREVATEKSVGFPWSECQVRKLATSHCTKYSLPLCRDTCVNL